MIRRKKLVVFGCFVHADGFVGHIAFAAFYAVVDAKMAGGAESLVVIGGHAEGGAQLFVEACGGRRDR